MAQHMEHANQASVAIITRTKNRIILLERCIRTVLAQTSEDWCHVIVNDGGDAYELESLVEKFSDAYAGRLKVIHNEKSVGMEAASNIGICQSKSRYLIILDDDDTWAPSFLQEMVKALQAETWENTRGIICHTEIVYEKFEGDKVVETGRTDFNAWLKRVSLLQLFAWNRFTPVCFLFERSVLDEIGMFSEELPVIGDWEFNIRFLSNYEIAVYPEYLAFWHQRPEVKSGYGNSVHKDNDLHEKYRVLLTNRWLREAIKKGTMDFGQLYAASIVLENQHLQQLRYDRIIRGLRKFFLFSLWRKIRDIFR